MKMLWGLRTVTLLDHLCQVWFCGVVVITSALHAEGREFEPRQNLSFFLVNIQNRRLGFDKKQFQ